MQTVSVDCGFWRRGHTGMKPLTKERQIGLTESHRYPVAFFYGRAAALQKPLIEL